MRYTTLMFAFATTVLLLLASACSVGEREEFDASDFCTNGQVDVERSLEEERCVYIDEEGEDENEDQVSEPDPEPNPTPTPYVEEEDEDQAQPDPTPTPYVEEEDDVSQDAAPSSEGNGDTVQTNCGPIEWGPAGPAPGAFTDDSAAQVAEAIQVMQAEASRDHVTVHKFCPGDDTPNGWIVGSSWTESQGIRVEANFLPAGVCVDYDPNVTTISNEAEVYHTEELNPRWNRTQLMSDGAIEGLKFTVYWTPCVFTDGTSSWQGDAPNDAEQTSSSSEEETAETSSPQPADEGVPATVEGIASATDTDPSNWQQHPQYDHGFIYNGPVVSMTVPNSWYAIDYDGGRAMAGETTPSGSAFTAWESE